MKGGRLFILIKSLSKKEHRQLVHLCIEKNDKRFSFLVSLLRVNPISEVGFLKVIDKQFALFSLIYSPLESDRKVRRLIDFSCKEIENFLVVNEILFDNRKRSFELVSLFHNKGNTKLIKYYLDSSLNLLEKSSYHFKMISLLDIKLKLLSRTQYKSEIAVIEKVMNDSNYLVDYHYHELKSNNMTIESSLFLDTPFPINQSKIEELKKLENDAVFPNHKLVYRLCICRFLFYSKSEFQASYNLIFNQDMTFDMSKQAIVLSQRSVVYLGMTSILYHGGDPFSTLKKALEVLGKFKEHHISDSTFAFLVLFLVLIYDTPDNFNQIYNKVESDFFDDENEDYKMFLICVSDFMKDSSSLPAHVLNNLGFSKSIYVSIWSRLLEIAISIKRKDLTHSKVLIERHAKFIQSQKEHKLIFEPSKKVIAIFRDILKLKDSTLAFKENDIFAFYTMLV